MVKKNLKGFEFIMKNIVSVYFGLFLVFVVFFVISFVGYY